MIPSHGTTEKRKVISAKRRGLVFFWQHMAALLVFWFFCVLSPEPVRNRGDTLHSPVEV